VRADAERLNEITENVIGCAYRVGNILGRGFLEKVYENALKLELTRKGLSVSQQHPVTVLYEGQNVGDYYADLLVENEVVVELKAVKEMDNAHFAQCLNYLKATGMKVGLLINFGGLRVEVRRGVNRF
jgi:GxxExxY protein